MLGPIWFLARLGVKLAPLRAAWSRKDPIMDKVLSLLISLGIVILGAWLIVATAFKGWPFGWALLALFALLTGFCSLYEALKATED
jgi:hypothetical protein